MIAAGIKLTVLGMGVVIFFLLLLILFIETARWILAADSARELAEMETAELRHREKRRHTPGDDDLLVAIISAAVAAHRSRRLSRKA